MNSVTYVDGKENFCTCGDFAKGAKTDPKFACKHILAVMNSETDTEKARYLEKAQPKLDPRFIVQIDGYPNKDNEKTAICKAHEKTAFGEAKGLSVRIGIDGERDHLL